MAVGYAVPLHDKAGTPQVTSTAVLPMKAVGAVYDC